MLKTGMTASDNDHDNSVMFGNNHPFQQKTTLQASDSRQGGFLPDNEDMFTVSVHQVQQPLRSSHKFNNQAAANPFQSKPRVVNLLELLDPKYFE